jgi:hypothetical protein
MKSHSIAATVSPEVSQERNPYKISNKEAQASEAVSFFRVVS